MTFETLGMSSLPDGEAMYAAQIRAYTTLPLEAKRVHEIGLAEFEKIQDERRRIAERLGFPDAVAAVEARTAAGLNVAASRGELLEMVEDQVRRSWEAAPAMFGRLPKANCQV